MSSFSTPAWWARPIPWILVAGLLLIGGILLLPQDDSRAADDESGQDAEQPPALQADAVVVAPTRIAEQIRATGTLRADESIDLSVETAGRITSMDLPEGQTVSAGTLLLSVSNDDLYAEQRRLQAQLELAEAREERQARLLEEGGVSQETYDATQNDVEVLQADLDQVGARIAKTEIRAPFTGQLGLRYVSEGSYISPDTRIATLQRIDPIKVDFSVPEKYAGRVEAGQPITFSVRNSNEEHTASVIATEPRVNNETRSLRVRARASNDGNGLRPGTFADLTLTLGAVDDALVVPNFALVPNLGVQRVFVYRNGQAQPQEVTIGTRTSDLVEITEGLAPGDTVLTSNIQELRPGRPIEVATLLTVDDLDANTDAAVSPAE
ncbi:efflux transporter periplasmic adaptor subunit [Longimonas halophila]|uniref:Efflux transporter periplasmic adaptor subunit n=1 Tax=Longimonas halophila TaxID=1469170 RepID=A0A2H3NV23_9BACT|nr:efflux RND transporter periplasmic adaptor subunit [Longimonas halophila]PEN05546.1 efflux transporter periplasmic adaptor subunit [Longimonas halophila]